MVVYLTFYDQNPYAAEKVDEVLSQPTPQRRRPRWEDGETPRISFVDDLPYDCDCLILFESFLGFELTFDIF